MRASDYRRAMKHVVLSEDAKARILENSLHTAHQPQRRISMFSKKKVIVIAAAVTAALGLSAFAYSGFITSWSSSSSSIPEYTTLPTAEQCEKDIGYAPKMVEQFDNGYTFQDATIVSNKLKNEDDATVESFDSLHMTYVKDGDTVYLSPDRYTSEWDEGDKGAPYASENGIDFYYTSYTNRIVPPDYEMTEEDKQAEANGDIVFSYGSDEVETMQVQHLSWEQDGVHYDLFQMDGKLSADDLLNMARQLAAA